MVETGGVVHDAATFTDERRLEGQRFPGARVFVARAHLGLCDLRWRVADAASMCDVIDWGARGYTIVDPASTCCKRDDDGVLWYVSAKDVLTTLPRQDVSRLFSLHIRARRKSALHAKCVAAVVFKRSARPWRSWCLPDGMLKRALRMPTSKNFFDTSDVETLVLSHQHTMVVPDNGVDIYRSFFRHGEEHLFGSVDVWNVHAFSTAIMRVCATHARGPVRLRNGAFVLDRNFFNIVRDYLPLILVPYLVAIRQAFWSDCNVVMHRGERLDFSPREAGYVSHVSGTPRFVDKNCTFTPPDPRDGPLSDFMYDIFKGGIAAQLELDNTPTLPPCVLNFYGAHVPGMPDAVRDNRARAVAAKLIGTIAKALHISPYRVVDHTALFAALNKKQAQHYRTHLAQLYPSIAVPACKFVSSDPRKKGLTCPPGACPRGCGATNNVTKLPKLASAADVCGLRRHAEHDRG